MKVDLYDASGLKKGFVNLNETLFGARINKDLMHRAIVLRLANLRQPIAHVKTRSEVAYSTKKLFRQKGTGNARRGARSSGLLRGGGVIHGPRNDRNFLKSMPKKERRMALFSALSAQLKSSSIFALECFSAEAPRTKDFMTLKSKLPEGKKYLFVLSGKNEVFEKSCRNIPGVRTILASYLNPYDVLLADKICFVADALEKVEETFLAKSPESSN